MLLGYVGRLQGEFWPGKVTRSRENLFQHTKLHHCSYISQLNLQHILWPGNFAQFCGPPPIRLYVKQYRLIQTLCGCTGGMGVMDITDVTDIMGVMDIMELRTLQMLRTLRTLLTLQELRTLLVLQEVLSDIWPPIVKDTRYTWC